MVRVVRVGSASAEEERSRGTRVWKNMMVMNERQGECQKNQGKNEAGG